MTKSSAKKRILLIAPSPNGRGGISSMVNALYDSPLSDRFDFRWLATQSDRGRLCNLLTLLAAWLKAPWVMAGADLLHIHTASYNSFRRKYLFVLWAILLRKKYILHIHGGGFPVFMQKTPPFLRKLYIFALRRAAALITLGKLFDRTLADYLADSSPERYIIPNPGRFPLQVGLHRDNPDKVQILYCGLLDAEKGVFDLIKAFGECAQDNWQLIMVGKGPHEPLLEAAESAAVAGKLELRSWQNAEELMELYRNSTMLVLPSYTEGMPMVLLEAMAFGVPVITTPVGGIPDMLPGDAESFLHQPGDTAALADRLRMLVNNRELRRQWSMALQQCFADRYTDRKVFDQVKNLYNQLL